MSKLKQPKLEVFLPTANLNTKQHKEFSKNIHQSIVENLPVNNIVANEAATQGTITIAFDFYDADRKNCSGTATCNGITKSISGNTNTIKFNNVTTGNTVFVTGYNPGAKTKVSIIGVAANPQSKTMTNSHFGFASIIK